jgi:hypothetical protein
VLKTWFGRNQVGVDFYLFICGLLHSKLGKHGRKLTNLQTGLEIGVQIYIDNIRSYLIHVQKLHTVNRIQISG